jgi:hypothetical protein
VLARRVRLNRALLCLIVVLNLAPKMHGLEARSWFDPRHHFEGDRLRSSRARRSPARKLPEPGARGGWRTDVAFGVMTSRLITLGQLLDNNHC